MASSTEYNLKVADYSISIKSIPFKNFLNDCLNDPIFTVPDPDLIIDGIIFTPLIDTYTIIIDGQPQPYFHTYGVRAKAVAWDLSNLGTLVLSNLDFDVITNDGGLRPNPPDQTAIVFNQLWQTVFTDTLRFYKITGGSQGTPLNAFAREFDLVYLDIDKFCELAGIVRNTKTLTGLFEMGETGSYYIPPSTTPAPIDRGFQISRASFDFDYTIYTSTTTTPVELGKARTLKFNPYPEPPLLSEASRPSVAYQLGIPCPPIWKNGIQSQVLRKAFEQAQENKLVPESPWLPPEPPNPPKPTFLEVIKGNGWARGLFLLLLLLIAYLLFLLSKN